MGILSNVRAAGPFVDEWQTAYETISKHVEEVDVTAALSFAAMGVKDEKELVYLPIPKSMWKPLADFD